MHPMEQRFAIMKVYGIHITYMRPDGTLSADVNEASIFPSLSEGKQVLNEYLNKLKIERGERDTYSVIPLVSHEVKPRQLELPSLPPPDFYEVGDPTTAEHIIEILGGDLFALSFTPVDNISGAGQMQSGLGLDPHDDRAVARSAKFSFPGWMEQAEIVKLHESATRHGKWKNCRVINRGNGFAKWFIVVLSSELR